MGESFGCACDRIHPTHNTELDHMFEVTESFLSLFFLHNLGETSESFDRNNNMIQHTYNRTGSHA